MFESRRLKIMATISALALVSGCGVNTLRVEYAGNVVTQGKAAAAASRDYLDKVDTGRDAASADLFAADPACGSTSKAVVRKLPRPRLTPLVRGWLCVPADETPGQDDSPLSMRPLGYELEPTVALIDALASYTDSLAEIVEAKPSDPAQGFTDALATARAAQGTLTAIVATVPKIPGADDPRVKAVTDFITFLGELQDESKKVGELRTLILANPDGAEDIIKALRGQLETWEGERKTDLLLRNGLMSTEVARLVRAVPPAPDKERREAIAALYAGNRNYRASARIEPALDALLAALLESDRDLRRVLRDRPNLTDKERAKVAEINRKRIIRALEGVTALITSFKGA